MKLLVNGKQAAIKSGSSFEYISENRLFTGSDGYTLSIEFPLKDCQQNVEIFGNIHRRDITIETLRYDCELIERDLLISGTLTITKVSETALTGQFLEGRSAQNFDDTFDDIYINELELGKHENPSTSVTPEEAWKIGGNDDLEPVALPWVNDSNDGATNNFATYNSETQKFEWDKDTVDTEGLSYFMYLLPLAKKICEAVGYTYNFADWENSKWRYLLVCNALPYAWEIPDYARALPHWSLTEFFEKIEFLLNCEFDIDHRAENIDFSFSPDVVANHATTRIEKVVDAFTTDVSADEHSADYIGSKNLKFKDPGYDMWSFQSCDWYIEDLIETNAEVQRFDTFEALWEEAIKKRKYFTNFGEYKKNNSDGTIYYAKDLNLYFILKVDNKRYNLLAMVDGVMKKSQCCYSTHLMAINQFGGRIVDTDDDADEQEIELIPVRIDETDDEHGLAMFLSPSSYDESYETADDADTIEDLSDMPFSQSHTYQTIGMGDLDDVEYYSYLSVGFWDGELTFEDKIPVPHVAPIEIYPNWQYAKQDFMLQLNNPKSVANQVLTNINPKVKYTFSFISDTIPSPRGLFIICGKKYICSKITATFSETGMSELMKGEFYPVVES
jgi:hypothetical protein